MKNVDKYLLGIVAITGIVLMITISISTNQNNTGYTAHVASNTQEDNNIINSIKNTFCNDIDDGLNYNIYGIVIGELNGKPFNYPDYCINSIQLKEYTCENNQSISTIYNCSTNCANGACIADQTSTTYCSDTDEGYNYNIYGTISGKLNDKPYSYTDYCVSNIILKEYACEKNATAITKHTYKCPNGCNNGKCIN